MSLRAVDALSTNGLETQQEDSFDQIIGYKDVHLNISTYMIGFLIISDIYI